jgi:hypothetical protein
MSNSSSDVSEAVVEIISAAARANGEKFNAEFRSGYPFKNVVIDNFLSPDFANQLLDQFPCVSDRSKLVNEFGVLNPKASIPDVAGIGGVYREIDQYIQTDEFLTFMSEITGIPNLLYDPWYFGAGTHENFHSSGLDPHIDFNIHPKTNWHRRINAIVYLNDDWDPKWGGDIGFHTDPWNLTGDKRVSFEPLFNRCVIFETTENSWHSVETINLPEEQRDRSRKSFTIYLYTQTRENEEVAPPHGTVYVQKPLPIKLEEGAVITSSDIALVNANLQRRHSYLKGMYSREYGLSRIIEQLKFELKTQVEKSYVPILGYAKLSHVDRPLFTDGWMAGELAFKIQAKKTIKNVHVKFWKPENESEFIDVELKLGEKIFKTRGQAGFNEFSFECHLPAGEHCEFSVKACPTFVPSQDDQRELSVIIDSIDFEANLH